MENLPNCPQCSSEYTYEDENLLVCLECAHEWIEQEKESEQKEKVYWDANGNVLQDGDTVSVIKDRRLYN